MKSRDYKRLFNLLSDGKHRNVWFVSMKINGWVVYRADNKGVMRYYIAGMDKYCVYVDIADNEEEFICLCEGYEVEWEDNDGQTQNT